MNHCQSIPWEICNCKCVSVPHPSTGLSLSAACGSEGPFGSSGPRAFLEILPEMRKMTIHFQTAESVQMWRRKMFQNQNSTAWWMKSDVCSHCTRTVAPCCLRLRLGLLCCFINQGIMRLAEIQSGGRLILPTPPAALNVGLLIPQHIISIRGTSLKVERRSKCTEERAAHFLLPDCTCFFAVSVLVDDRL